MGQTCRCACAVKGIIMSLITQSALGDYQKPMGVLNQLVSHKSAARALVRSAFWLPEAAK